MIGERERIGHFYTKKRKPACEGPYVHLDQFLEAVEERIRNNDASDGCEYCWRDEFRKLAKEIKEANVKLSQ